MPLKHISSIRASLAWLVVICLMPVALMMAGLIWDTARPKEADLVRKSLIDARSLSAIVDSEFVTVEKAMLALASSPLIRNPDLADFYEQSKVVANATGLLAIALYDAQLNPVMHTLYPNVMGASRPVYSAHLKQALETGKPVTSAIFMGAVVKDYVTHIAIPVTSGRGASQVLIGALPAGYFQRILEKAHLPSGQIVAIFDRVDTVVAVVGGQETIKKLRGKKLNQGLLDALGKAEEGTLVTTNLQGEQVLNSFIRSQTSRWGIDIGIPRQNLRAAFWDALWQLIGISVLILSVSIAFAWVLGGRIAGAVQALRGRAQELGAGRKVVMTQQPLAVREAQEVALALVDASKTLAESNGLLVSSEARLRSILRTAKVAIITVDAANRVMLFNPAAAHRFGYTAEQAMGMALRELLPDWPETVGNFSGQTRGLSADGQEFPVDLTVSLAAEADVVFYTVIIRDISEQVRARKALERSNRDLKQFAFVASHDLKTPLRSIGGFVQMLAKSHAQVFDTKATDLIERTLSAVRRLEQMTDDLLRYAQIETVAPELVPVHMADVAREVISLLDASITEANGTVTMDELPTVMGDRTQLVQLLLNLVGNSLKYCRGHAPQVHLRASQQYGNWVFSVTDNGIGIDVKYHGKVFEIFKRLHSQSEFAGTGIGLAVCKRIVDAHGGKIWVSSEPGVGSTFSFTIQG